jgi:NADPH-dependent curcumin reductase CurA
MSTITSREVHLVKRPTGLPTMDNFALASADIPDPAEGQIRVRNLFMSVDPYMRGRMVDRKSYTPPFQLGEAMTGGCIGQVIESRHPDFNVGDVVSSFLGWREVYLSDGSGLTRIDPGSAPLSAYLGVLGMPGQTAYFGLLDIGQPKAGETVFVSAAAGAVGALVCQIAKLHGCRVVGSAGSDAKVAWLLEKAGVDAAFNYKTVPVAAGLAQNCPDGIDVYFENVGGEHLQAAISRMNNFGRIVACGMIALYNATEPIPAPHNLAAIIGKRIRMQGFIVSDFAAQNDRFVNEMSRWIEEGKIDWEETVLEGIEQAPQAFVGLFSGENLGKMVVNLAPSG